LEETIAAFEEAVLRAYGGTAARAFEQVSFIKAFLRACFGFDDNLPIHYPRATPDGRPGSPSPAGEAFKWFVANEKQGTGYALRNLWNDNGLPTLWDPQAAAQGRRQRRR
jgi:hypothetical protein